MTAQELAAEMHKFGNITLNRWAIDGAAMLRQQAEQIEALKAECETRKAYGDEQTEFAIKNANERDLLKADAERWVFWRSLFDVDSKIDPNVARRIEQAVSMQELDSAVDAAIDAMKGAT